MKNFILWGNDFYVLKKKLFALVFCIIFVSLMCPLFLIFHEKPYEGSLAMDFSFVPLWICYLQLILFFIGIILLIIVFISLMKERQKKIIIKVNNGYVNVNINTNKKIYKIPIKLNQNKETIYFININYNGILPILKIGNFKFYLSKETKNDIFENLEKEIIKESQISNNTLYSSMVLYQDYIKPLKIKIIPRFVNFILFIILSFCLMNKLNTVVVIISCFIVIFESYAILCPINLFDSLSYFWEINYVNNFLIIKNEKKEIKIKIENFSKDISYNRNKIYFGKYKFITDMNEEDIIKLIKDIKDLLTKKS